MKKKHHKTIVLSDIHLGSRWSKSEEVTKFLSNNSCDTLILCGDIIDGWSLSKRRKNKWKEQQTNFIRLLFDIQKETKIIYIKGNHDDFLDKIIPFQFENIKIVKDYIYTSGKKNYYVLHGDVFDKTVKYKWISKIGDSIYTLLLGINKKINDYRLEKGLPYYPLSQSIKNKVKLAAAYMSGFEKHIVKIACENKYDGIICGHIHRPEKRFYDGILYLNSGDWVESMSALSEDYEGNWEIIAYAPELKREMDKSQVLIEFAI